jgi:hypothetical protein
VKLFGSNIFIGLGNEGCTSFPGPKTKEAFNYNFNGLEPKISFFHTRRSESEVVTPWTMEPSQGLVKYVIGR